MQTFRIGEVVEVEPENEVGQWRKVVYVHRLPDGKGHRFSYNGCTMLVKDEHIRPVAKPADWHTEQDQVAEPTDNTIHTNANGGKQSEPADYDRSIHSNPSGAAWAAEFVKFTKRNPSIATDEGCMIAWFCSAMMAMHDHLTKIARKEAS